MFLWAEKESKVFKAAVVRRDLSKKASYTLAIVTIKIRKDIKIILKIAPGPNLLCSGIYTYTEEESPSMLLYSKLTSS